jgi:hypothetical protein
VSCARTVRRALAGTALVATVAGASAAFAAPPRRAPDAAEQWFAHGLDAARAGDLVGARRAFGAAYALVPSVDILWNLATTERKLGESVLALEHLRAYVASPDARPDRKTLAEAEMLPELELVTAHLVIAEPEGTVVLVDGKPAAASATLDLPAGVHAITVRRDGLTHSFALDTPPGTLTRLAPAEAPRPVPVPVPALVSSPSVAPSLAPSRTPTVLVLGGGAVLSVAAGIYFSFAARDDQETSDRLLVRMRTDDLACRRSGSLCSDYDSARSSAQRNALLGTSFLVGGGLLGGAAVVAWVLWPSQATRIAPVTTKDSASVTLMGRF